MPPSHLVGVVILFGLIPVGSELNLVVLGWLAALVMLAVGLWESRRGIARQCAAPSGAD
jgi:hypothetical protein